MPGTNSVLFDSAVVLNAGEVAENHYFLGWYRGTTAPAVGTNVNTLSNLTRTPARTFNMPASGTQYFALWGARDVIGDYAARITFHTYGEGTFAGGATSVIVPVAFGEPLNLAVVTAYLENLDEQFAFWGWFTDGALNASGRTRNATGLRRPTVGTNGFTVPTSFTQAEFEALADAESNLNLYAIWSLWGDVDDDDAVGIFDLDLLRQYVLGVPGVELVRPAAKVTRGTDIGIFDLDLLRQYVLGAYPLPVLGRRP
jgi:hypothetical protein